MNKVKLGDIAKIYNGNSINVKTKIEKYSNKVDGWSYIGTKDLNYNCEINYDNGVIIPFDDKGFKIAPKCSFLVCSEGGNAGKKTAFTKEDICFGNKLYAIVNYKDLFNYKYVFYYTRYNEFFQQFKELMNGIIGGVSAKKFNQIELPLPPIEEQEKIVLKIEELFSELDKGIDELNKAKDKLVVYRQAVLKSAFSGENRCEISQIVDDIKIGPFGTMLHQYDYIDNGVPVINPKHIKNLKIIENSSVTISKQKAEELKSYKLKTNDIVMGRRGEMGRVAVVTKRENGWICGTGSILFRFKKNYSADFYVKILSSPEVIQYLEENATGTTMKNLNEKIVKKIGSTPEVVDLTY